MNQNKRALLIGAFIVGAALILSTGLALFGSGALFRKDLTYVAFFDGSVKGLRIGAPITFRGVRVGTVADMRVTIDERSGGIYIPVHLRLESDRLITAGGDQVRGGDGEFIGKLIQQGLKAQCQLQSLVTGQLIVDLDFFPERPMILRNLSEDYPEMPTVASRAEELASSFDQLPVGEILTDLSAAVQNVSRMASSEEAGNMFRSLDEGLVKFNRFLDQMAPTVTELEQTLAEARITFDRINREMDPLARDLKGSLTDARRMIRSADAAIPVLSERIRKTAESAESVLGEAQALIGEVRELTGGQSPLRYELSLALRELTGAAKSVRDLAETLEQHPEALLRGKPDSRGH
ncbi:MAG: MlaD family protein [Desulfobacterales bacterium]|jgi:paraquat-inducible protein B